MKTFISLVLGLSLAVSVQAQGPGYRHVGMNMINNGGNLYVSNNTTFTYGNTNFIERSANLATNFPAGSPYAVTNSNFSTNTYYYPQAVVDAEITSDGNGDVAPLALTLMLNDTNWVPADKNNNQPNIVAPFSALNASNVNVVTVTIAPIMYGTNANTTNTFAFSAPENGVTAVVVSTNLPTSLTQGAHGIRLVSIARTSVTTTTPLIVNGVVISQFRQ